jgi:hypothetical protein
MNNDVLTRIADQFSEIEMKIPVEQIYARARTRRSRRRGATVVATGAAALAAGLTAAAVTGSGPHQPPPVAAQLAAFSVSAGPNGTSALTLRKGQQYRLDPVALARALAEHHIAALVTVGKSCDTAPEPAGLDRVVVSKRPSNGSVTLTINPAAMPAGSALSVGYYQTRTTFSLIQVGAPLHCTRVS